jgi:NAD(P)-dependent dehydrogenase (short-subunit alcohol dehydrogenase family)
VRPAASENHRNQVTVSYLSGGDPEDAAEGIRPSGYRSKAGRSSWLRWAVRARAWRWWSVRASLAVPRRQDIDWTSRSWNAAQAYSESKLHVTALALTLARVWPEVLSNTVDPGWVPTKMGGPAATGDLKMGYLTQTWLAVSNDAAATVSGGYWYHRQRQAPAAQARDPAFQDRLAALTGVTLF